MNIALINFINAVVEIFGILILIEIAGSWLMAFRVRLPDIGYRILAAVGTVTGLILNPIRRIIPSIGGLDISPIIALMLMDFVRRALVSALVRM